MVKTDALTYVSLAVSDPERSLRFYSQAFGAIEYCRDNTQIQSQGPGPFDDHDGCEIEIWFE